MKTLFLIKIYYRWIQHYLNHACDISRSSGSLATWWYIYIASYRARVHACMTLYMRVHRMDR